MTKSLSISILAGILGMSVYFVSTKFIDDKKDDNLPVSTEEKLDAESNTTKIDLSKEVFTYSEITDDVRDRMIGKSMPPNEPVSFNTLSYLNITYYGFDGKIHIGEMIVNKNLASEVIDIFKELYEAKYPIEKMRLIDEYDAVDEASMADNNSSAFCYRTIANTDKVSNHGLGLAIDVNPLQNPHVIGSTTSPKEGASYADRTNQQIGMIKEGDACYNAFIKRGWSWGGYWKNPDYQHFEKKI